MSSPEPKAMNPIASGFFQQRRRSSKAVRFLGTLALLCSPVLAAAATDISAPAGTVVMVTGKGTIADTSGTVRAIVKGGVVYNGEIINSSAATYINIRFSDGGMTLLRPKSRFKVEDYRNIQPPSSQGTAAPASPSPTPSTTASLQQLPDLTPGPGSHAFFRLLKGGFRAVSGLIGRVEHDDYSVTTPVATIGIRGTDYIAVICDNACATDPVILKSLPHGIPPQGGLVTAVKHGRIALGTQGLCPSNPSAAAARTDCVEVQGGEYHFTSSDGQQIDLPSEPQFMKADPMPDPLSCKG